MVRVDLRGLQLRLTVHPLIKTRALEAPAIAKLECRNKAVRSILVERIWRDAEVVGSLPDVHYFADFRDKKVVSNGDIAHMSYPVRDSDEKAGGPVYSAAFTVFQGFLPEDFDNFKDFKLLGMG